ncbi:MAG: type II toxin-antitoxin system RelE/ParE family toxin [Patescibacteria group bacterium]
MLIKPINSRVKKQLRQLGLFKQFAKQTKFFEADPFHPSLHTEKLEPKSVGLYSFRIDRTYRAIFRIKNNEAEIIHISKHYHK